MKPRVFLSSIIEGFDEYRNAAAAGIRDANAEPVRVNEDFPSLSDSSRNACLDAIASCDALVLVVGAKAGWVAPSGRFVIEEEYDEATRLGRSVHVFLETTAREPQTQGFVDRISDFVHGLFRHQYRTAEELRLAVKDALIASKISTNIRMLSEPIARALAVRSNYQNSAMLRMVIGSVREEEIFDPLKIHRPEFQDTIITVGSSSPLPFFGIRKAKEARLLSGALVISQDDRGGSNRAPWYSDVTIDPTGLISAETSIGRRQESENHLDYGGSYSILTSDLTSASHSVFHFITQLFDLFDPYVRHRQLEYNVGIHGLGYRYIIEKAPSSGGGIPMRMSGGNDVLTAFDKPRSITRDALAKPEPEVARVVELLKVRAQG